MHAKQRNDAETIEVKSRVEVARCTKQMKYMISELQLSFRKCIGLLHMSAFLALPRLAVDRQGKWKESRHSLTANHAKLDRFCSFGVLIRA